MYTVGIYERDDVKPEGGDLLGYFSADEFLSLSEAENLRQKEAAALGSSCHVYVVAAEMPPLSAKAALLADIGLRNARSRAGLEALKARRVRTRA